MGKWFYKHYRLVCMIFLGCVFVGWTAFMDISDRNDANSFAAAKGTSNGKSDSGVDVADNVATPGNEGTSAPDEDPQTEDITVPTQVVSNDPQTNEPDTAVEPAVTDTPAGPAADNTDTESGSEDDTQAGDAENPGGDDNAPAENNTGEPGITDNTGDVQEPEITDTPEDTQPAEDIPTLEISFKYALAAVDSRLNIRSGEGTDSAVIAYLKPNGYCEVLEWGPEWTKIKSGSVTGYAYTPYLLFNNDAIKKLRSLNKLFVRVNSNTVNIRAAATTESEKLGKGTRDSRFIYIPEQSVEGWYCIQYSETQTAFVSADYTEVFIDTSVAVPLS